MHKCRRAHKCRRFLKNNDDDFPKNNDEPTTPQSKGVFLTSVFDINVLTGSSRLHPPPE